MTISRIVVPAALASALFAGVFATGGIGRFDFWWWMSANAAILAAASMAADPAYAALLREDLRRRLPLKLAAGLLAAVALYAVFWAGNHLLRHAVGADAAAGIDRVYDFRKGASTARVAWTIGLLVGPVEEIFWRGFLQRHLAARWGSAAGLAAATALYAAVHVASGNPVLVLAAAVCGVFWGWMYLWWKSVVANVVSHTAWDLLAFLILPFGP